jgi:hypothetical protein
MMQFLTNNVGLPANSVVKRHRFLEKNLEKVIKPRFLVLQEIKSLNGLGHYNDKQFCSIISMPEAKFLSKIVEGHPQSATLYRVYEKAISNVSGGTKILRENTCYSAFELDETQGIETITHMLVVDIQRKAWNDIKSIGIILQTIMNRNDVSSPSENGGFVHKGGNTA